MSFHRNFAALALIVGSSLGVLAVHAQVSVAPTALFLNDQERFGALYISNPSGSPQEVTIGFRFGYSAADSAGLIYVEYTDSTAAQEFSIADNVRAFPQRFVLPPGETQVVRLTARPPDDFEDGWRWTRVLTTSTPQVQFADTTSTGVQANLIFRLQQVTALFYTRGDPTASLDVRDLSARVDSNEVVVMADVDFDGNRPFLGRAFVRIFDGNDTQIAEDMTLIAVYRPERRRLVATLPDEFVGSSNLQNVRAEVTFVPDRPDVPQRYLLNFQPIVASTVVEPQ